MSFLQCPKRLWLEVHRPGLRAVDAGQQARFDEGHAVGELARRLYDPTGAGTLIDGARGMGAALRETARAVERGATPLFEATVERDGLLVRADVIDRGAARLVEVKSATSVKDEHLTDCAIQAWALAASPLAPKSVALARIDNQFTYAGDHDYRGLLAEEELTDRLGPRLDQVPAWLDAAKRVAEGREPRAAIGTRCDTPYACPFKAHCWPATAYPLANLPGVGRRLDALLAQGYTDVRDLPEDAVPPGADALRAWRAARSGRAEVGAGARAELAAFAYPRHHLDFETVAPAIPLWAGTRPYQAIPFQWSLHVETAPGQLEHAAFLDLSGAMPARAAATALLDAVRPAGPVFMYTSYEKRCLDTLAAFCPDLAPQLQALAARLVDLHPIVKRHYCHPAMQGSWSIKAVLPTIAPEMDYARLEGIADGGAAQQAYLEAIDPATSTQRREEIHAQLLRYCGHDTLAMVRIAAFLGGSPA